MQKRTETNGIRLHHTKSKIATVLDLHQWHVVENKWSDIGYHAFIDKNGSLHFCRPIDLVGAHSKPHNRTEIGLCFEGDFEFESPSLDQLNTAVLFCKSMNEKYGKKLAVGYHRNVEDGNPCPGVNFPRDYFEELLKQ